MSWTEIKKLENEIAERVEKIEGLRKNTKPVEVKNYQFQNLQGKVSLQNLFGSHDKLFAIHNMGTGCRWCTSWADAINGVLLHLESEFSVVLLSKDSPEVQRNFALSRGWKFNMASHGGGEYMKEQNVEPSEDEKRQNMPGIVCYEKIREITGDKIYRKNSATFGPGDLFNPLFHIVTLAGVGAEEFTPQYQYWKRPEKMLDGGENLI